MKQVVINKASFPKFVVGDLPLLSGCKMKEVFSYLVNNRQKGDCRQRHSAMTTLFNKSAFTLIELLVVVLIIGILSAIALPQYQKTVDIARVKAIFPILRNIKDAENMYKLENNQYTKDISKLSLDLAIQKYRKEDNSSILLVDDTSYTISDQGTYWSVQGQPNAKLHTSITIYLALPTNLWKCYQFNTRGKRVCEALCKTNMTGGNCTFNP